MFRPVPEQEENKMLQNIPVIDLRKTGQNIAALRTAAGLSVRELQDMFGFATPQAIYKWQNGLTMPTVDNLVILASVLGVQIEDILILRGA